MMVSMNTKKQSNNQRLAQLVKVIQAALDAHATLRSFDEINFKILDDPLAIERAIKSPAQP